jgi:gas vesicle protein
VQLLAAEENTMANKLTAVGCFAVGAGIGAALGVLYAPRAGKHTRTRLRNSANRALHRAEEMREDVRGYMSELVDEVSESIVSGIETCGQTVDEKGARVQETLNNVRERIDKGRERVEEYVRSVTR